MQVSDLRQVYVLVVGLDREIKTQACRRMRKSARIELSARSYPGDVAKNAACELMADARSRRARLAPGRLRRDCFV